MEQVRSFADRVAVVDRGNLTPEAARGLGEYALMLEEFRVAVFAQELGTAMPVSAARLDKKWREIKGMLTG